MLKSPAKRMRAAALLLVLSGCGAVYTSPQVSENSVVEVVPLTLETLKAANATPYQPRALPAAFSQIAEPGQLPALPRPAFDEEARLAPPQTLLPPPAPDAPYRIGVSDLILLSTPQPTGAEAITGLLAAQTRRQGYTVQDDGAISVPDVGRIALAGLTLDEAEAEVFQALVARQVDPAFSIEISEFNSQHVSVGGAVKQAVLAPITLRPLYLGDALQLAGGATTQTPEFASIRIARAGKIYTIPLEAYRADPALQKLRLVSGDTVMIESDYRPEQARAYFDEQIQLMQARASARAQALSERRAQLAQMRQNFEAKLGLGAIARDYAYLAGEVGTQNRFPLPFETKASLADILYDNGGVPVISGDISQIYVLRGNEALTKITAYHLDAENAANLLLSPRFELHSNDVVFVAEQPITAWNRVIGQIIPTLSTANSITN